MPLGGPYPPLARPGCSSAALRRALALGGWPWRVFAPLVSSPRLRGGQVGGRARLWPPIRTVILSYAKHGRCQANAQGRTRLLSFPAARKQVGGIKARGFGLCGSAFRNVLQASVDHGLCVSARSGCLSAKVSAPRSRSAMVPRTPRRRVAGNRGRRGGCATRFQRFEWRETCVILPEPLEFSSSVRAVGATVRASSLPRGGAAAASGWEPTRWKYASSLAADASAPPASP